MPSDFSNRALSTIGPSGEHLTLQDLPPSDTVRWVIRRKAELVAAIRGGLLRTTPANATNCLKKSLSPGRTHSLGTDFAACALRSCSFTESHAETERAPGHRPA